MRLTRYWTKPRGGAGWLAMAGMAAGIVTWWPIAAAAGGGWFALALRGYRRSARAMAYLETAFPEAQRTGALATRDLVSGTVDGMPFEVRNGLDTMHVLVGTPLPHGILVEPTTTGYRVDSAFPYSLAADDSDSELAWRMMLTADMRRRFADVFAGFGVKLRGGWFDIVIDDDEAHGPAIERLVRDGVALGQALFERVAVEDRLARFVEQIPREPVPEVRSAHYAWLVQGGYEVPALLRLASQDPDDRIRAWANTQRPAETLYR